MIVRRAADADSAAIHQVHDAAFAPSSAEAALVEALREDGDLIDPLCLVALADGAVVGHVACSRGRLGDQPMVGLAPIGVLPSHQARGVGKALMHAVLAAADAIDEPAVVLLGDPNYYARFGFEPADRYGVLPPVVEWAPHFQIRPLHTFRAGMSGTFRYAPAFDRL